MSVSTWRDVRLVESNAYALQCPVPPVAGIINGMAEKLIRHTPTQITQSLAHACFAARHLHKV